MIRKSTRIPHFILLAGALGLASLPAAALKDKPPSGVALHNTGWLIDPTRSDDPDREIEAAIKTQRDLANQRTQDTMDRGVMGDDGPLGRGSSDGPWGGRYPGGDRRRDDFPPNGDPARTDSNRGGWGSRTDRTSTDIDPTGQSASVTLGTGGNLGVRNEFIGQLTRNPQRLSFLQANQRLTVSEDKLETDCTPGVKEPISDLYGDGERRCGWDGRAWVIETTRGKKHFARTDRFEVSKDGKTLRYVTTASGSGMPRIRLLRTYTLAPPAPPAGN